jgi:hypothetical protein
MILLLYKTMRTVEQLHSVSQLLLTTRVQLDHTVRGKGVCVCVYACVYVNEEKGNHYKHKISKYSTMSQWHIQWNPTHLGPNCYRKKNLR